MNQVRVVPLGGAGEIGKNCTAVVQGDDIVVVDVGLSFPHEEQFGVDIVIPDFQFLLDNKERIRAIFLTHAHEDHVGALGFLLTEIKVPVYCTRFAAALVKNKLDERANLKNPDLRIIAPGDIVEAGSFKAEFIRVTHSIPESNAIAITTGHGIVLFTGDFKLDFSPVDGLQTDMGRLTDLAKEGVVLLVSDSTNVDRPGWGPSESRATEGIRQVIKDAPGRVFVTMFSSNIHRMQQVVDVAKETGRRVATTGRRMETTIETCRALGYITIPDNVLVKFEDLGKFRPDEIIVFTTGSQGEPMAALTQMSRGEYNRLRVVPGDTVLYSARPIPGNEGGIWRTINRLFRLGANVVYENDLPIHVSGHAYQEELKMMINITKPFYLAPVHGEPRHQYLYRQMAIAMGHPDHRILKIENGDVLVIDQDNAWVDQAAAPVGEVLIDQHGNMAVTPAVLQERSNLGHDGVVVASVAADFKRGSLVGRPKLQARGVSADDDIIDRVQEELCEVLATLRSDVLQDRALIEREIEQTVRRSIQKHSQQRPVVVSIVSEV